MIRFTWLTLLLPVLLYAQPPDSLWSRTYGGGESDKCYSAETTEEGGFALVGFTNSFGIGYSDAWLLITNSAGDSIWSRTFGGSEYNMFYSLQRTRDRSYILAGASNSYHPFGDWEFYLVKVDLHRILRWNQTFNAGVNPFDICTSVWPTEDGGCLLAGYAGYYPSGEYNDFYVVKTDHNGNEQWGRRYGGGNEDLCRSIQLASDSGYVLSGYTSSFSSGGWDVWLLKIGVSGDSLWSRTFGGIHNEFSYCIRQAADGGYLLAGATKVGEPDAPNKADFWVTRVDARGDSVWTRTFGGSEDDECNYAQQTTDGGYILAGYTKSFGAGNADFWLLKIDADGDSMWSRTFGGFGEDVCTNVVQTNDGCYALSGYTRSFGAGHDDFWLVKTGPDHVDAADPQLLHPSSFSLSSYPNPFNPTTTISFSMPKTMTVKLSVFDVTGRSVKALSDETMQAGEHQIEFDGTDLSSGIYFARLSAGDLVQTQKMVLLK